MACRKNYRDLTQIERDRLVQALYHLKSTGVIDQFATEHDSFFNSGIHHTSHFLPWHREFLRRFEVALRTYHPDIAIPYWNSTVDTSPSDPLWDNSFIGQFDSAWGLGRNLGGDTLPTPQDVLDTIDANTTYGTFWHPLELDIHNPPHNWVGGVMASTASPGDPVFYMHHCWIDMIWAQWQLQHPNAFDSSGTGFGLDDPMESFTTTPADVLDHRTINLYHYPPDFPQQDLPQVVPDSLNVNFLTVPEGETFLRAAVYSIDACEPVHLTVVSGPTLISGPPATMFTVMASPVTANPAIDSKGRVWFTYTGTNEGDSAAATATIRCDETGEQWDFSLTANTIRRQKAAVVLVLDQSNSMNFDSGIAPTIKRKDVLKFSAPPAVDVAEDDHAMAICSFDHDPHPSIGMTPLAGIGKLNVRGAISNYAPNVNGWTSIGEGVAFAHDILDPETGYDVKAMVVLTDGEENHGPYTRRYISDVSDMINEHVFAIGLGRPEALNPGALQSLCNSTDGYMMMTGDLNQDAYFRLAKYYQQILAGVTNYQIVRDPEGWILPGQKHRIPFWLNEADIAAKGILLSPAPQAFQYTIETPKGDVIDPSVAGPHPMASFEIGEEVSLYRVGLPIPLGTNIAHSGLWYAILTVDEKGFKRYLKSVDNQPELYRLAMAHGIRYGFSAHTYSNIRMFTNLSQTGNEPGAAITVRAKVSEYDVPVVSRASCRAELTRPDDTMTNITMDEIEPGIFQVTMQTNMTGIYSFHIVCKGVSLRGHAFTREQRLTGAVWFGGNNVPPSTEHGPDEGFCNLIYCLLKQKGIQEMLHKLGVNSDELRSCLDEYCRKPSPGQTLHVAQAKLVDMLKSIISDKSLLEAVMREMAHEIE
jgi:Common central domain of tyrosinase/von Willebrand factor type A domain